MLFFLSRTLIESLASLVMNLTHRHQFTVNFLAILFLPGTIIHELSHLLVAGVMLVPVGELEVLPEVQGKQVKLGSVQIGQTDPFRRTIIGVAPVLVGLGIIFYALYFVKDSLFPATSWWQAILALYIIFQISNTMFSSKKDLEGTVVLVTTIIILIFILLLALYLTGNLSYLDFWGKINFDGLVELLQQSDRLLLFPLIIDVAVVGILKLILKRA